MLGWRGMPIRYRVDHARGIVHTTLEGEISAEDLWQHATALASDPDTRECNELADLTGITGATASAGDVRAMGMQLLKSDTNRPGGKFAMVAPTDVSFGMARLYQAHREHPSIEIRVFREREEALAWLEDGA